MKSYYFMSILRNPEGSFKWQKSFLIYVYSSLGKKEKNMLSCYGVLGTHLHGLCHNRKTRELGLMTSGRLSVKEVLWPDLREGRERISGVLYFKR